jgi:hypothetical protein
MHIGLIKHLKLSKRTKGQSAMDWPFVLMIMPAIT